MRLQWLLQRGQAVATAASSASALEAAAAVPTTAVSAAAVTAAAVATATVAPSTVVTAPLATAVATTFATTTVVATAFATAVAAAHSWWRGCPVRNLRGDDQPRVLERVRRDQMRRPARSSHVRLAQWRGLRLYGLLRHDPCRTPP